MLASRAGRELAICLHRIEPFHNDLEGDLVDATIAERRAQMLFEAAPIILCIAVREQRLPLVEQVATLWRRRRWRLFDAVANPLRSGLGLFPKSRVLSNDSCFVGTHTRSPCSSK